MKIKFFHFLFILLFISLFYCWSLNRWNLKSIDGKRKTQNKTYLHHADYDSFNHFCRLMYRFLPNFQCLCIVYASFKWNSLQYLTNNNSIEHWTPLFYLVHSILQDRFSIQNKHTERSILFSADSLLFLYTFSLFCNNFLKWIK